MLEFTVVEVQRYCPIYGVGDKLTIDDRRVVVGQGEPLCNVALSSVMEYVQLLEDGVSPKELGLARSDDGDYAYVRCVDKCAYYSEGGCVFFRCRKIRRSRRSEVSVVAVSGSGKRLAER